MKLTLLSVKIGNDEMNRYTKIVIYFDCLNFPVEYKQGYVKMPNRILIQAVPLFLVIVPSFTTP